MVKNQNGMITQVPG